MTTIDAVRRLSTAETRPSLPHQRPSWSELLVGVERHRRRLLIVPSDDEEVADQSGKHDARDGEEGRTVAHGIAEHPSGWRKSPG